MHADVFILSGCFGWFGNLTVELKSKLPCLVQTAMKVMGKGKGKEHQSLHTLYERSVLRHAQRTLSESSHILLAEYELLPLSRRYRRPKFKLSVIYFHYIREKTDISNTLKLAPGLSRLISGTAGKRKNVLRATMKTEMNDLVGAVGTINYCSVFLFRLSSHPVFFLHPDVEMW